MKWSLQANDELREQGQATARWQVVDPKPRDGWIKLFDLTTHQDQYKPQSDINEAIVDGRLVLCRNRAPRISAAAQNDPKLDRKLATARASVQRIEALQKKYQVCGFR